MEVRGPSSVGASAPVSRTAPVSSGGAPAPVGPSAPRDEVEISSVARMLDGASRTQGIREQRLAEIKAAIEAGTYDTPEKLQIALSRMLDQVGGENG